MAQFTWSAASAGLLTASAIVTLAALDKNYPPPLEQAAETSTVVVDRNGALLRAFTISDGRWRLPVHLDRVDPQLVAMLIAYEDKRFLKHNGIDPLAMARAAVQLATHGRIVSGGSTITMQLARLLEPRKSRSLGAKLRQALRALQIELRLTKHQILEHYLTLAPYGGNLEGVRAASLAYFGKEPLKLTVAEAALLVALPQLPEARRPDRNTNAASRARNRVLKRMVADGVVLKLDAEMATQRPVRKKRYPLPALAAHLSERLRIQDPGSNRHDVTIIKAMQVRLEVLARERIKALGPKLSIAMLVADARTGEILARVGSSDYFSRTDGRAIDMTLATRSPGSTLKPFIYGLAFDAGIARPETLIEDSPTDFSGYTPRNFDNSYKGTVSLREALQLSLNIPAVTLLEAVGPLRLMSLFKRAGVRPRLPRNTPPSLAIALGGVGMNLQELVSLYTAFPGLGIAVQLHDVPRPNGHRQSDQHASRLLSNQAGWHVNSILAGTPPPDHASSTGIAFKTGTSYGYRDAWAVGFDGAHVMGIWIGRPDGASVPGLSGRTAAAPVLFEGFRRIAPNRTALPDAPSDAVHISSTDLPRGLRRVQRAAHLAPTNTSAQPAPSISYPPDGAQVELPDASTDQPRPLVLKVHGGAAPFSWFANGTPVIAQLRRRQAAWTPDGRGFSTLTVIDAEGRSDRVTIFVK